MYRQEFDETDPQAVVDPTFWYYHPDWVAGAPRTRGGLDLMFAVLQSYQTPLSWYPRVLVGLGVQDNHWLSESWKADCQAFLARDAGRRSR